MRAGLFFIALLFGPAQAGPVDDLRIVGSASFNWLLWKVYDISLLTPGGTYDQGEPPLALVITYARDIAGEQLLSTTIEEWERQQIGWKQEWVTRLDKIFPDVSVGDQLLLRVDERGYSAFYFNGQPIGVIEEPRFSDAFLSIWLSSNTRSKKLTRELMGSM